MQRLEVSGAVRRIYGSLGFKRLRRPASSIVLFSKAKIISHIRRGSLSDSLKTYGFVNIKKRTLMARESGKFV